MRIALWGIAAIVFLLPLIAMQVTDEVDWGVGDSVLFGLCWPVSVSASNSP